MPASGLTTSWTWANTVTLIVQVLALIGAVVTASVTYSLNRRADRRDRRADAFADALAVIEEYVELPYRIRRRPQGAAARYDLAAKINEIQAKIAFQQAWLRVQAPSVAVAYDALVDVAKKEAGGQMVKAWKAPKIASDAGMNLGVAYPRQIIDEVRSQCIAKMLQSLGRGTSRK